MLKRLLQRKSTAEPTIGRQHKRQPASRWAAVMPPAGRMMRVTQVQADTEQAVRITLQPCDGGTVNFRAGQYLTCCLNIDGQPYRRPYSICSAQDSGHIQLTCKAVDKGVVSNYLCQQLAVGDEFEVRGPSGDFCLQDSDVPLYCVAAGSGITPVISLLQTALQQQPARPAQLIYANRQQNSILFDAQLAELQDQYPQLSIEHVLSQPQAGWAGARGRLDGARIVQQYAPAADAQIYLCGPQALMHSIQDSLETAGFPTPAIHCEAFTPAPRARQAHPQTSQRIVLQQSAQEIEQAPGQSMLDAALAHGAALDFSCTVGGCAACKVKVLQGDVIMDEPHCLSDEECAQGMVLACSAYATSAVVLDA